MKITVHGLGHVGAIAAAVLANSGHEVLGLDVDRGVLNAFGKGHVPYMEPDLEEMVGRGLESGALQVAHEDDVQQTQSEVAFICVGTPSMNNGGANLSYVRTALRWVVEHEPSVTTVIMKSTVPPGTGRSIASVVLRDTGIDYVSNPEFLRESHAIHDWLHPDRIVIGAETPAAFKKARAIYEGIEAPVVETDITSAEMIKYAANAFLATKITFINEIANLCQRVGATVDDVTNGIGLDPRIGASYLQAGLGYGGSCFPKDVRALDFLSTTNGHSFELLRAVITVNNRQRLLPLLTLRETFGSLQGLRVAVLGLSFKPGTNDTRDAPALDLISLLEEEGATVTTYDPVVKAEGLLPPGVTMCSDTFSTLKDAVAAVLCTEWNEFVELDWEKAATMMKSPKLVFDGRNALDQFSLTRLGFDYRGVGRGYIASQTSLISS